MSTDTAPAPEPEAVDPTEGIQASQLANQLAENPEIAMVCQNLLVSRRLYHMARVVLNREIKQRVVKGQERLNELAEEVIVQAMGNESSKPYTDEEVLRQISGATLPFLQREVGLSRQREAVAAQAEAAAEEAHRRELQVPLGYSVGSVVALGRTCPLVLVGPPKAVSYLLGLTIAAAGAEPDQGDRRKVVVAHLLQQMQADNLTDRDKTYVRIGINKAIGSANTHKTFDKLMSLWRRQTYKHRVDLLVIEHLSQLYDAGVSGRSDVANAASALKSVSKWAEAAGCAVLAGVHAQPDDAAWKELTSGTPWETLCEHAAVVVVRVGPAQDGQADMRELVLGDGEGRLSVASELVE